MVETQSKLMAEEQQVKKMMALMNEGGKTNDEEVERTNSPIADTSSSVSSDRDVKLIGVYL